MIDVNINHFKSPTVIIWIICFIFILSTIDFHKKLTLILFRFLRKYSEGEGNAINIWFNWAIKSYYINEILPKWVVFVFYSIAQSHVYFLFLTTYLPGIKPVWSELIIVSKTLTRLSSHTSRSNLVFDDLRRALFFLIKKMLFPFLVIHLMTPWFCVTENSPLVYPKWSDLTKKLPICFQNTFKNSKVKPSVQMLLLFDSYRLLLWVQINLLRRIVVRYPHHTSLQTSQNFSRILKMGKNRKWIK